jgi:putative addiction module killer protein
MQSYTITYFEDDSGRSPFIEWLEKLKDRKGAAIIRARIDRLRFGLFGDSKYLDEGVYELRIQHGPGYRIYYIQSEGKVVVLLCAGNKSTQPKDIKTAIKLATLLGENNYAKITKL